MQQIITFEKDELGYGSVKLHCVAGSGIPKGVTAVCGPNGSGKSTFGLVLEKGRHAFGNRLKFSPFDLSVKLITFTDIHSLSGMEVTYYHQRMEATMNEYVPTVEEIMTRKKAPEEWRERCEEIGLKDVAQKKINYLSSGELRKLLIVNSLLSNPDLLILDNPYIGLDKEARADFNHALQKLAVEGMSVVLLVSDRSDIPTFTDYVMEIDDLNLSPAIRYDGSYGSREEGFSAPDLSTLPPKPAGETSEKEYVIVFKIEDGRMRYGDKTIFSGFNWEVRSGECWRLSGRNGSGKSLLLSMICGDNPQGYANRITLFDRQRGSGESIFQIKDNIGFVSPEMQLYFKSADNVREIVVQGKRNSLNRYRPSSEEEKKEAETWLRLLEIEDLAERKFTQLSAGEQRLVLVARALIKQPPLLVLDEPFHGLDKKRKARLKEIINALMKRNHGALIFVSHYDEELPECVSLTRSLHP